MSNKIWNPEKEQKIDQNFKGFKKRYLSNAESHMA